MKSLWKLVAVGIILALAGCASQDTVDEPDEPVQEEVSAVEPEVTPEPEPEPEPAIIFIDELTNLDEPGIAGFVTGTGVPVLPGETVNLATGGSQAGRLIPVSTDSLVTLYVTRDGSLPSATNNWGGPIDPSDPLMITRQLEGSGVYRIAAELDGEYSADVTVYVYWTHEEEPELFGPEFQVSGQPVYGSVEIPVSDGTDEAGRLYIVSDYSAATLYITRDGTDPSPENYWKSQVADGTYIYSPAPTAAAYRVVAVWQDAVSWVTQLNVTWVE